MKIFTLRKNTLLGNILYVGNADTAFLFVLGYLIEEYKMKEPYRLLFVCDANMNRSPTFENYFNTKKKDIVIAKSAGLNEYASVPVTKELLYWADIVYVMDLTQAQKIYVRYKEYFNKVRVIGIPDNYYQNQDALIKLIEFWIEHVL